MSGFPTELKTVIRANHPVIWVVTHEEERLDDILIGPNGIARDRVVLSWSQSKGMQIVHDIKGSGVEQLLTDEMKIAAQPVSGALQIFGQFAAYTQSSHATADGTPIAPKIKNKIICVFRDLHRFLGDTDPTYRLVRDLAAELKTTYGQMIVTSPMTGFPAELEKEITVLPMPLPDRDELDAALTQLGFTIPGNGEGRDAVLRAGQGLTLQEFILACNLSLARSGAVGPKVIIQYKEQAVRKSGVLELVQNPESMDDVGGLANLKQWADELKEAYTQKARQFGVKPARAVLLTGPPGSGKSLSAKALSSCLGIPMLTLKAEGIFAKHVGDSEQHMASAFRTADAASPCILFTDEVEKFLAGASGGDTSGVSRKVFGQLLTWMNDHKTPVLFVATSNNPTELPPEFASRFEKAFFVDLPSFKERAEIFTIHLRHIPRDPAQYDVQAMAGASEEFSGREIEQVLSAALRTAYKQGREMTTQDVLNVLERTKPQAVKRESEIRAMQDWSAKNADPASDVPAPKVGSRAVARLTPVEPTDPAVA